MARHHKKLNKCPNCGTPLRTHDNFCPNCGQENHELKVPFSHLFLELFESVFHFETKFFTTLKSIFTRPGRITLDFWNGKRARYMHPFRLYLFVSLLFFLAANKFADKKVEEIGKSVQQVEQNNKIHIVELRDLVVAGNHPYYDSLSKKSALENYWRIDIAVPVDSVQRRNLIEKLKKLTDSSLDSLLEDKSVAGTAENRRKLRSAINLVPDSSHIPTQLEVGGINVYFNSLEDRDTFTKNLKNFSREQLDSTLIALHVNPSAFNRTLLRQVSKFDLTNESVLQNLTHVIMKNLSFIMFILMPLVAFLLLGVFYRLKRYYFEHLIFSIHAHTVLFIVFTLAITLDYFFPSKPFISYSFILNWIYFFLSLKTVYQQGWLKTLFKFFLLSFIYLIILVVFLAGAFIWGVLTF